MQTNNEELHEIPTPSQAEGSDKPEQPSSKTTPSQAEGDLKTVEEALADEDLADKE